MNYKKNNLILLSDNDAHFYLDKKENFKKIYVFTPNIYALLKKKNIENLQTINKFINNRFHLKIIALVKKHESVFNKNIKKTDKLNESIIETIKSIYTPLCYRSIYLFLILKKIDFPITVINNSGFYQLNSFDELYKILIIKLSQNFISEKKIIKPSKFNFISDYIVDYTSKFLGKKVIIVSTFNFELKKILINILKKHQFRFIHLDLTNKNVLIKSIIFFINLLLNKKFLIIPISLTNIKSELEKDLDNIFNKIDNKYILNSFIAHKDEIYSNSIFNYSIYDKIKKKINAINPSSFIAHEMKFCDNSLIAEIVFNNSINSILISHGSHTDDNDRASNYVNSEIARGLIDSKFCNVTLKQSPITKTNYGHNKNKNIIKSHPVIWSVNSKHVDEKTFNIVYAGTVKDFAQRPWTYETPFEMLESLSILIKKIKKIKNIKLLIKFRDSIEMSFDTTLYLLPKYKFYHIKQGGNFSEDLIKANLVISNSSTTIEEALYSRVPVLLFQSNFRYTHIQSSMILPNIKKRYPVYQVNNVNMLSSMISNIINFHGKDKLTDDELNGYIYTKKESNFKQIYNFI